MIPSPTIGRGLTDIRLLGVFNAIRWQPRFAGLVISSVFFFFFPNDF